MLLFTIIHSEKVVHVPVLRNKGNEAFKEAYNNYENREAGLWLGRMYELGMYVKANRTKAKEFYEWAAEYNQSARAELERINTSGFLEANERTRNNVSNYLNNLEQFQYNMSVLNSSSNNSYGSGSNSSSSSITCRSCGGTGRCTGCSGKGKYWAEVGQYTGYYHEKETDCPICRGTGRCIECHGNGSY